MIQFPPPPFCSLNVSLLRGKGHRPDKSNFLRAPKLGLEGALYSTFSLPKIARYAPPPPFANSQARPKRGSLKSAGKRQESATFLQRSFFNVAMQFFACCSAALGRNDVRTAEQRMLQCNFCSATFGKLHRDFRCRQRSSEPPKRGRTKRVP